MCVLHLMYTASHNVSDKTNIISQYYGLSSIARNIPKYNVWVIGGDMNA